MARRRGKKWRKWTSLRDQLDPRWPQRLPDHAFNAVRLPEIRGPMRLDLTDDGATTSLVAEFAPGAKPQTAIVFGSRKVRVLDSFGRPLAPLRFHIEMYRPRESRSGKPKYLSLVPGRGNSLSLNPDYVFDAFDTVMALDTNSPGQLGGDDVSVLGIAVVRRSPLKYPGVAHIYNDHAVEFRNLAVPHEKNGWALGIDTVFRNGWARSTESVLVIVDHALDQLMAINEGAEIVPGFRLPANVKIAYASGETGKSFAVNRCLRAADKVATITWEALVSTPSLHELPALSEAARFKAVRLWNVEDADGGTRFTGIVPAIV